MFDPHGGLYAQGGEQGGKAEPVSYDKDAVLHALAELVKCRTVSYDDHALEDDAEFEKLIG